MDERILPRTSSDEYRGRTIALWLFAVVILLKIGISAASIFNAHDAISKADGIPLDSFPPAAARALQSVFMLLGWSNLVFCIAAVVVLLRYRGLVPVMYALWLLYELGKRAVLYVMPIERAGGTAGLVVTLSILVVMVVGFLLSLGRGARAIP